MKMNRLFAVLVTFALVGCAVPLAGVQVHQALPMALPKGCFYVNNIDNKGNESGNYVNISGVTTDPGLTYMQVSYGSSLQTMACSDAAMQANYADLYKGYMLANFNQGDEALKKEVDSMKVAVLKLSDSMVDLAEITAASKPTPVETAPAVEQKGKDAKDTKKGKDAKPVTAAPAPAPVSFVAPAPTTAPAPVVNPSSFKTEMAFASNYAELINVLTREISNTNDQQRINTCTNLISLLLAESKKATNNFADDKAKVMATFIL